MATKRKISIRKILQVIFTITVTTCCIVAMISAAKIEGEEKVKSVAIHIRNDKKYHFIEQKEITDMLFQSRHIDIENTTMSKLDIYSMEHILLTNPWVAAAEVYIDNDRVLHIYVTQRIPAARLFQQNNTSYYLDTTLSVMPLSKNNIYYTTVFTNVPDVLNDSAGKVMKKQIVTLARAIQTDSFWNAQVSEVIVDSDGTFEMTPVLGDKQIVFGDLSNMKEKFNNLFTFYKDVLNRIGWDKYDKLDVRFNGQVVASPSLPYKGPVDKAVVNMNWINTMVEAEEKGETKDSILPPVNKPAQPVDDKNKIAAKKTDKPEKPPQKLPVARKGDKKETKKRDKNVLSATPKNLKIKPPITNRVKKMQIAAANKDKNTKDKTHKNGKQKMTDDKVSKEKKDGGKNGKGKQIKDKNTKQVTPKYVYPDKNH